MQAVLHIFLFARYALATPAVDAQTHLADTVLKARRRQKVIRVLVPFAGMNLRI